MLVVFPVNEFSAPTPLRGVPFELTEPTREVHQVRGRILRNPHTWSLATAVNSGSSAPVVAFTLATYRRVWPFTWVNAPPA